MDPCLFSLNRYIIRYTISNIGVDGFYEIRNRFTSRRVFMADEGRWSWASLSPEQEAFLKEGERTLGPGVDILLAYQPGSGARIGQGAFQQSKLEVGRISDSQIECLRGLEKKVGAVVIAYQQAK
jgi:hypothetical protein